MAAPYSTRQRRETVNYRNSSQPYHRTHSHLNISISCESEITKSLSLDQPPTKSSCYQRTRNCQFKATDRVLSQPDITANLDRLNI